MTKYNNPEFVVRRCKMDGSVVKTFVTTPDFAYATRKFHNASIELKTSIYDNAATVGFLRLVQRDSEGYEKILQQEYLKA